MSSKPINGALNFDNRAQTLELVEVAQSDGLDIEPQEQVNDLLN